jgi:hypothetical protein
MAVLIKFGSGVVTPGATQARATIKNIKIKKSFGILLSIFPSFRHECGGGYINYKEKCGRVQ